MGRLRPRARAPSILVLPENDCHSVPMPTSLQPGNGQRGRTVATGITAWLAAPGVCGPVTENGIPWHELGEQPSAL